MPTQHTAVASAGSSVTIHEDVERLLTAITGNPAPTGGAGFAGRAEHLAQLEVHVLDRLQYLEEQGRLPDILRNLRAQAEVLRAALEEANAQVIDEIRHEVLLGRYTPAALAHQLLQLGGPAGVPGQYETLDLLVDSVFAAGDIEDTVCALDSEMVGYQPTPARAVFSMLDQLHLGADDVFYDLGSGLGTVVMLTALLSGCRAKGIEFEPVYCEYAARAARALNVRNAIFIHGDVREAPLADGTVFFMYTPFRGAMLQQVLRRLEREADQRPIRICTYGPLTADMVHINWLRHVNGKSGINELATFQSQ